MNVQLHLRKVSHHVTWLLATRFSRAIPLVFVVGYPKSGTTWVSRLVAEYLGLPFPTFALLPIAFEAVVHGHELVSPRYARGVYVLRDGRDALVSQYFQLTRHLAEGDRPRLTRRQRRNLPGLVNKADVARNLGPFVEQMMTRPQSSPVNWGGHVRSFFETANPNVALLRFEDLLGDGAAALAGAMGRLTGESPDADRARAAVEKYAFETMSGRERGEEDRSSYLRKGQAGDWVNYFTPEAAHAFDRHCGNMLIAAGYEKDHSWAERVSP